MTVFDYAVDGFDVREPIVQAHRESWASLARAGSHWNGAERVEIARQARAT